MDCIQNTHYRTSHGLIDGSWPMIPTSASTTPTTKKRTVRRGRLPNTHYRVREYLTSFVSSCQNSSIAVYSARSIGGRPCATIYNCPFRRLALGAARPRRRGDRVREGARPSWARSAGASPDQVRSSKPPGSECCWLVSQSGHAGHGAVWIAGDFSTKVNSSLERTR